MQNIDVNYIQPLVINNKNQKKHKLIINADDFGYSQFRDKGILELIKLKKIKSITALINGRSIQKSAKRLKELFTQQQNKVNLKDQSQQSFNFLDISIGLHLNLTQFHPVSKSAQQKNQLINNETGEFLGKSEFYKLFCCQDIPSLQQKKESLQIKMLSLQTKQFIKREIRSQIQKFIHIFTFRPSHIDGHNHIHLISQITQLLIPIMKQYGILKTRILNQSIENDYSGFSSMNKIFLTNSYRAKILFQQAGVQFTDWFLGLSQINSLNVGKISQHINSLIINTQTNLTIQLMCHPGYVDNHQGDEFNRSINRQIQLTSLKSPQFVDTILLNKNIQLSNFYNLPYRIDNKQQKRILLYSKMSNGSGNWTTSLRLQSILQSLGYKVYLRSIQQEIQKCYEIQSLRNFLIQFKITLIIGVNLTRSAQIIYQATRHKYKITYRVPFLFIVAGTDANIYFHKQQALQTLALPIQQCSMLISLSQNMIQITKQFLRKLGQDKQIVLLSQSSNLLCFLSTNKQQIHQNIKVRHNLQISKSQYILFPTSFRPVKDILFLLATFNHLIQTHNSLRVIILGPILNHQYYEKTIGLLGKVQYWGTVGKDVYLQLLRGAMFLVNTSQSEGQSCALMEALQVGQISVVRDNQGNTQLIKHCQTGFFFSTPQQFQSIFNLIYNSPPQYLQAITQNGKNYHYKHFSIQAQTSKYKQILQKILPRKQKLFNYSDVHPVSDVNLQLFSQISSQILIKWLNRRKELKQKQRIIDLGCGSGIFGLNVVKNIINHNKNIINHNKNIINHNKNIINHEQQNFQLQIQFYDCLPQILSNTYYNVLQELQQNLRQIKIIKLQVSNMFEKINVLQHPVILLANMPQTPFPQQNVSIDRNGGIDALKYNRQLLFQFTSYPSDSLLIMLYSYMSDPKQFFSILQQMHNLQIIFQSQKINHVIHQDSYEKLHKGLSHFLTKFIAKDNAQVIIQKNTDNKNVFYVPAQILIIRVK